MIPKLLDLVCTSCMYPVWMYDLDPYEGSTDSQPTLSNAHLLCVNCFDVEPDHTTGKWIH